MHAPDFPALVQASLDGDRRAVEALVSGIQRRIYNLAVRFFWEPADAEDATQEILIRILTRLDSFRGESQFTTWAYRIAANYLLNAKRSSAEQLTFEEGEAHLQAGLAYPAYEGADHAVLETEVKLACSTSMLACLSRPLRLAYLIGEILEYSGPEAAAILETDPATFRKRLSLARQRIRGFMAKQCGIYNPDNPCRCARQIRYSVEVEWIDPQRLRFAGQSDAQAAGAQQEIEQMLDEAAIFHSHPDYQAPERLIPAIRNLLQSGRFPLLNR
ncbi:MAG: RNA polymerase sigma factor [Bacteroidia bacterium]|nr:RNA polymerase sigma factor [Bacteroidia bacterium]